MITTSHVIYSWALAKKTEKPNFLGKKRTLAFVLGAVLPDIPTYLFFLLYGVALGYSGDQMWGDMYFNSGWSIPITLSHSFIIWPVLIAISSYLGLKFLKWFSISALFHSIVDFTVHTGDAYRHFYPFSDWKFHSPISYWNSAEYGQYVSTFDSILVLGLLVFLYQRYNKSRRIIRIGIICVGVLYGLQLVVMPFAHQM